MIKIGDNISHLILGTNEKGDILKISDFSGHKLVLYFYPKDNTPGCTAEACSLRNNYDLLKAQGYEVIGVSKDTANSHIKFKEKHELPFSLITDTELTLHNIMGTWGEKTMCGKKCKGTLRTTFIIDENGVVSYIFDPKKIKTKEHGEQILNL